MADLRDLIAETLAAHVDYTHRVDNGYRASCTCGGWSVPTTIGTYAERALEARLHRADALLAALDGQLLPADVEANRQYGRQMPNGLVIASATGETHYRLNGPWRPVEAGQTPGGTGDE